MIALAYDGQLSRVRVTGSALEAGSSTAKLERSTDGIRWTTVRGAGELAVTAGLELELPADDYEFVPDVANTYRLTTYDAGGAELGQHTSAITPDLAGMPWLKVIARPFLNRPVIVGDYSELSRPARAGVFDVVGRSFPVVVSDVRSSARFELQLVTETDEGRRELALALAGGETVYLQVPADSDVPAGYLHVGDATEARPSRRSERRIFTLAVTEVAAPAADVVGAVSTWQTVLNTYSNWSDVIAAHATWADLLELIGNPEDVIVE